jgi:hypothetical protein
MYVSFAADATAAMFQTDAVIRIKNPGIGAGRHPRTGGHQASASRLFHEVSTSHHCPFHVCHDFIPEYLL